MSSESILKDAFVSAFNSEHRALSIYGNAIFNGVSDVEEMLLAWHANTGLQSIMSPDAVIKAVDMLYNTDHGSMLLRRFVLSGSVRFKMALGVFDCSLLVEALHANYSVSKAPHHVSFIPPQELAGIPEDSQETTGVLLANNWYMFLICVALYIDNTEMYQNFITSANKGINNDNA